MDIEKNRATVQLITALTPILERLQQIARTDPTVGAELHRLGEALIAFAIESQPIDPPVEMGLPEPPVPLSTVSVLPPTEIAPLQEAPPLEAVSIAPVVESQWIFNVTVN